MYLIASKWNEMGSIVLEAKDKKENRALTTLGQWLWLKTCIF